MPQPDVIIATTPQQREDAYAVRIAVFVDEQQIPREEELDDLDDAAIHCIGYLDGAPVAAGRLVISGEPGAEYGKIGRMAVLRPHRGAGVGATVLAALERAGAARGLREFRLSAQLYARGFYDRLGYTPDGDIYDEVGIPHIAMLKSTLP